MNKRKNTNEDKYFNRNPFHRFVLNRFLNRVFQEIQELHPRTILDFGCGGGYFLKAIKNRGLPSVTKITGIDICKDAVEKAKKVVPEYDTQQLDIFSINPNESKFDLVMAIEVLEHLNTPEKYLKHIVALSSQNIILTVPYEPWFRLINLLRGRDIKRLGDHPEHINHWSLRGFRGFVTPYFNVVRLYSIFPWLIVIGNTSEVWP